MPNCLRQAVFINQKLPAIWLLADQSESLEDCAELLLDQTQHSSWLIRHDLSNLVVVLEELWKYMSLQLCTMWLIILTKSNHLKSSLTVL
jgi:hypothetical protein